MDALIDKYGNLGNRLVFVSDGATWIKNWIEDAFPKAISILDYYQVCEHLHEFSSSIFTDKKKEKCWTDKQKERLLKGEVKTVITSIKRIGKNTEKANQLISYYSKNRERMKYQDYVKIGYGIIGSGAIESAHRTLVQKRMKQSGQRWSCKGAQNMLNLRVARKNNDWNKIIELSKSKFKAATRGAGIKCRKTNNDELIIPDICRFMSRQEKILLFLLASINFTHILDFMIMMPLGNYLMPFFKISPQQFTMLVAAYTLSAGVSGFIAAFFVDSYDRKKILLIGYIGFLAGTIACGFAPSFQLLLVARLLAGIFGGLIGAQVLSIVSDVFAYERRGAAMGVVMSSFSIASTIGVPFSLYLANIFSWHAPFLLVGFLGIIIIPFINKYVPAMNAHILKKDEEISKFDVLKTVWQNPTQKLALLFSGLIMMGHFLIIPFINPYLEFNNGYSKTQTPMVYLVGGIAAFFAANVLGKMSDRYGKLRVFTICILLSLPLVIIITMLPPISFSIVLALFALWFILATGRGVTAQAMVSNVVEPQKRGSFMSFNSSIQQLGTAAASLIAGFIVISGNGGKIYRYEWLGYLSVFILLVCAYLGYKIFKAARQIAIAPGTANS